MAKKPRKRIIPEYDYKSETVIQVEVESVTIEAAPEPLISGEQFTGLETIVDVESTKYSSDMFDFDDNKEE